ncbi:MAG: universal stress protein [Candidatus Korobacteraceae bacterium]
MFPIRRILVPVDFSARSVAAAEYASSMAAQLGAELKIVHVLPPLEYEYSMVEPVRERQGEIGSERAKRVREELENIPPKLHPGVNLERLLVEGDPSTEIVNLTKSERADLVVMPTSGKGSIRRFLLGSVVSKVLHDTECPVWTGVHLESPTGPFELKHLVCAVDFGPHSHAVLSAALGLAKHFGARVTLVYATPHLGFEAADFFDESWRLEMTRMAREQLRKLADDVGGGAELIVEAGDPDKVVSETAKRVHADLVVIGRGAIASGLGRLRANAYAIIRRSPCAVLSI